MPRKILRDNIQGLTNPAMRRLARRAGIKRIRADFYATIRGETKGFLEKLIHNATTFVEHAKRTTVTHRDIKEGLRILGTTAY